LPSLDNAGSANGHTLAVNAVAVSPNGKFVATAGTDQTIKVWDIQTGKEVSTLIGNADTPYAIAFLGNENLVMGGSLPTRDTGRLHLWGVLPPRLSKSVATGEVYSIVASSDGTRFAAWATRPAIGDTVKNNTYEIYDAKGDPIGKPYTDKGRNVRSATFTPDLTWAVAGDATGGVQIFDLAAGERVGGNMPLFQRDVADIGVTADKKFIVATDDTEVKVGELKNGKLEVVAKGKPHNNTVRSIYVSPTGKNFITISNDREVKLWSLTELKAESLKELRSWVMPVTINSATFTPDGKSVITANADGTAYVLELP
jgi:WD40 repeat protein